MDARTEFIVPDKDTKSRPSRSQSVHTSDEAGQCPQSKGTQESGWNMAHGQTPTVPRVSATTKPDGLCQAHVTWLRWTAPFRLHVDCLPLKVRAVQLCRTRVGTLSPSRSRYINPLRGKTINRRAGCGRPASPVRREGRPNSIGLPYPYQCWHPPWHNAPDVR